MGTSDVGLKKEDSTERRYPIMNLIMPLVGVVVGVLLTVFSTGKINDELWLKQDVSSQRKMLIEKRIGLIERASKLLNSRQIIEDVNVYLKAQSDFAIESSNCAKDPKKYGMTIIECKQLIDLDESFEKIKLKNDLNAEFGTLAQLTSLYFGDQTKKYSMELSKLPKWWLADRELLANYIHAMNDELYEFKYR